MQTQEAKKPNAQPAVEPVKPQTSIAVVAPAQVAASPQPPPAALATIEMDSSGSVVRVGFDTPQGFEALQRVGKAFANSTLVPDAYRNNLANCVIAIEMANRMGASPLMVMQNLYLVHGRPSWSSQFLIASFNNCGRFSAIKYKWSGEKGKSTWGCTAYAREKATGEIVESPEVTIAMAKAEGWIDKKGSKWLTIPQLMITYRAATFLVRTTAPELTMGLHSVEEQEDIGSGVTAAAASAFEASGVGRLKALQSAEAQAATVADPAHDAATGEVAFDIPPGTKEGPDGTLLGPDGEPI